MTLQKYRTYTLSLPQLTYLITLKLKMLTYFQRVMHTARKLTGTALLEHQEDIYLHKRTSKDPSTWAQMPHKVRPTLLLYHNILVFFSSYHKPATFLVICHFCSLIPWQNTGSRRIRPCLLWALPPRPPSSSPSRQHLVHSWGSLNIC